MDTGDNKFNNDIIFHTVINQNRTSKNISMEIHIKLFKLNKMSYTMYEPISKFLIMTIVFSHTHILWEKGSKDGKEFLNEKSQ